MALAACGGGNGGPNTTNGPPMISGLPATSVVAGSSYSFTPTVADPGGATLSFSVQNAPSWTTFNAATGELRGTPASSDIGSFADIVISVSNGTPPDAALPAFTIKVTAAATYTVVYNGNGSTSGSVPIDPNSYASGATVTVLGNTGSLARDGYIFANWNTAADGGATTYAAGDDFAIGATDVTLYAQWSPSTGPPTDAERANAATLTAENNPQCAVSRLGPYYWEIGDVNGAHASGSMGAPIVSADTVMLIYSASKWLYAANVVQKHGVLQSDVPFLNFTSGYSEFGNSPFCPGTQTVLACFLVNGPGQDPATIGKFDYDSGHMQYHAAYVMGLGADNVAALAADLAATLGLSGFAYNVQQPASGISTSAQAYANFLRGLLNGELALGAALGSNKVCAQPSEPGCNAAYAPESLGSEDWNYSLGHWVEDDPVVGDHAFSSAGGGGFYPWIDATKTYYGILARNNPTESGAGYNSAECGRLIRQAYVTGRQVTATEPTPTPAPQ